MQQRTASEVADLLEEIGRRAAFEGGNPYKAKAYVRAAASLRRLPRSLDDLISQGALFSIPGVGEAIAKRIESLHRGERDEVLERMRSKLPSGLLELLAIPGLKPQHIMMLHTLLGVNSLAELEAACGAGKLAVTKGIGPALQRKILQGIAIAREGAGQLRMNQAQAILTETIAELQRLRQGLSKITIAGDLRRGCELISDLRIVAVDPKASETTEEHFGTVTLHVCAPAQFGAVLLACDREPGSHRQADDVCTQKESGSIRRGPSQKRQAYRNASGGGPL